MKNFKRLFIIVILAFLMLVSGNFQIVYADENGALININVEGGEESNFKAGEDFTIKIDISDLSNLFAASFTYTYDNTLVKIDSIDINDSIQSAGVYEPYKETDKDGNRARYCFTLLGDNPGFSGNYDFATIKGKTLKDGKISVGADNINFQLINRNNDNMQKGDYTFKTSEGDIYKVTNVIESNKETGENSAQVPQTKEKSDVKVELIKKAEDSTLEDSLDKEQEESNSTGDSNDGIKENSDEEEENSNGSNNKSNSESEEECSEEKDSSKEEEKTNSSIVIIIASTVVISLCIIAIVIHKKNSK